MIRVLKSLSALALVAVAAWSGWWFIGARGHEAGLSAWFEARAAEGWQAELAAVETGGFPDRFVTRLDQPALADPDAGWAWSAPVLTFASPATDPTSVTATFPARQTIAVPGERASIESQRMEALLSLFPGVDLQLREGSVTTRGLIIDGQSGWRAEAETLDLSVVRRAVDGEPPETHDVKAVAERVVLPAEWLEKIDPAGLLAPEVSALRIDALAVPDRQLDRHVIEDGRIGAKTVVLRKAELDWDGMGLVATGRLDADAEGRATGEVDLSLRDWRRLVAVARSSGALPGQLADAVEGALSLVAMLNRSETLDVTVRFDEGRARIGPVVIGEAPRMLEPPRASRFKRAPRHPRP